MHLYYLIYENYYTYVFCVRCPFNGSIPWDKMTMPYKTLTDMK